MVGDPGALRKAVEAVAANGCIHTGWAVAAGAADGKTGRDSHHKTDVGDSSLCDTVKSSVSTLT